MKKERPMLFKGEMVRAILDGRKTQTRRIVKPQPRQIKGSNLLSWKDTILIPEGTYMSPYGPTGDLLWVRETHLPTASGVYYRADFSDFDAAGHGAMYGGWKPGLFCKRAHSRITLEIVRVRVERLQDITEDDARAEGVSMRGLTRHEHECRNLYERLWESINGPGSWALNPWVWVVEFKKQK